MKPNEKVFCLAFYSIVIAAGFLLYGFHLKEQRQAERKYEQGVLRGQYQIKWRDSLVTFSLDPTHLFHQRVVLSSGKVLDRYGVWKFVQGDGRDRGKELSHYEYQADIELQEVLDPLVARNVGIPYGKCYYRVSAEDFYYHRLWDKSGINYPPLGKRLIEFRRKS